MPDERPRSGESAATVAVFGATVAGLTAAHELARRGFAVSVVVARGEIAGGSSSRGWLPRARIVPFASGGRAFPRGGPVPAETGADPLPPTAQHLLDTLANIPSATGGSTIAGDLVEQPWWPLRRPDTPLPFHPRRVPRDAADVIDGVKAFVDAGYTPQDGHTFLARTLRYLTSSFRRRQAECQTVSTLDYLRGASAAAVPTACEYSPAFLADIADLADPIIGTQLSMTDAHTGLGAYAQSLTGAPGGHEAKYRRFSSSTRAAWFEPWIAHLRDDLGVKFLTGHLARLTAPFAASRGRARRATVTAHVAGGGAATRRVIAQARYVVVATDAAEAEAACAPLPPVGVPGALRGFGAAPTTKVARAAGPRAATEGAQSVDERWQPVGGIQLFLPERLVLTGPLTVAGSRWRLVLRPQLAFDPRPPAAGRDRFGCVLAVDVGAWHVPSPRIGKAARDCDQRELAHEIWAQIEEARALRTPGRSRPRRPSWFAVDGRVALTALGRVGSVERRLVCLPGDWINRPGPEPGSGDGAPASGATALLWRDPESGGLLHWNRLVFAGDYLKTRTRAAGAEAACESGRRAANAIISHARARPAAGARPPRFAPIFDPEAAELAPLGDVRALDDWCARERLPHPFAIAGVDGWITLVSWFGVLYPASGSFMKTILEKLVAMARSAGSKENATHYQEAVLEALRKLRDGLQREAPPGRA